MSRLWDVAEALLNEVWAAFEHTDRPPAITYVADGAVTQDFGLEDALIVGLDRVRAGTSGAANAGMVTAATGASAELSIYVVRPAPMPDDAGDGPTPQEMSAAAQLMFDDAWLVLSAVMQGAVSPTSALGVCADLAVIDGTPLGPTGGVEGFRLRLAVTL